jgi:L-amino acid N-acyltransferase
VRIRAATEDDLPAIRDLYNALIPTTTTAWTEHPESLDDRRAWFAHRTRRGDGVLVAEDPATSAVVGFAAYGPFRDDEKWPGYRFTAEHTVHVAEAVHGQGVGRALVLGLLDHARTRGLHVMVAAVDGANEGSIRFHERLGFEVVARMPETGFKFGRWLDLVLLQRTI